MAGHAATGGHDVVTLPRASQGDAANLALVYALCSESRSDGRVVSCLVVLDDGVPGFLRGFDEGEQLNIFR